MTTTTRVMVIMFTDLVDSTALKGQLGNDKYVEAIARPHNNIFRKLLKESDNAVERDYTGDGFMATFASVKDAVICALRFHDELSLCECEGGSLETRIGIHMGDMVEFEEAANGQKSLASQTADMAHRIMGIAQGGQTLLTRAAYDSARQSVRTYSSGTGSKRSVEWMAHGRYEFKGSDEPMEVFEVGIKGIAPFRQPSDSEKARRISGAGVRHFFADIRQLRVIAAVTVGRIVLAGFLFTGKWNSDDVSVGTIPIEHPNADGWITFFPQDSLESWTAANLRNWELTNGVLVAHLKASYLRSLHVYTNFHFKAEVMTVDKGAGAILFRSTLKRGLPDGYRAKLVNAGRYFRMHRTGAIADFQEVTDQLVADNYWFRFEVIAIGNRLIVRVNDRITCNIVDPSNSYDAGRIVFHRTKYGGEIKFRDAMIKRLPPGEKEAWGVVQKELPGIQGIPFSK
jgi:class 3 adenylate cyclase